VPKLDTSIMANNSDSRYIFWLNDLSILYKNDNYLQFVPSADMTRTEQLNAMTRFCIYLIILVAISGRDDLWLQIPIICIIFIIVLHKTFEFDGVGKRKELERLSSIANANDGVNTGDNNEAIKNNEMTNIEASYYDSNGELQTFSDGSKQKLKHTLDEIIEYKKATCRKPTKDNPFMNLTVNDFMLDDAPQACNIDDEDINDKIVDSFNADLFRDVGDLFEVKNNQRQFYTVPTPSSPPDTVGLAKWLYGGIPVCKTSQQACFKYEDLKYKHNL